MRIAIFDIRFVLLLALVLINLSVTVAYAKQQRAALVIGNGAYQKKPLTTPVHDAYDMAVVLRGVGFKVTHRTDVDQFTMEEAMVAFGEKLRHGVVGLFYYSGYAAQYEGENYLIPNGAMSIIKVVRHLRTKAVKLDYVLSLMEKNGVNIIILDACRPNPFNFSIKKGLTTVKGVGNMLIAYPTSEGEVSESSTGRNSFYTKHLLQSIKDLDLPVELMLKKVRAAVKLETGNKQIPWYTTSLDEGFNFKNSSKATTFNKQPLNDKREKATLTVHSNVDSATLFINGKNYNFIPNGGKEIELSLGQKYTVQVQKKGYIKFTKEFFLKKDETVNVILQPEFWLVPPW